MIDQANGENLTPVQEFAFRLVQCSIALDQAWEEGGDKTTLIQALNDNLELWVALRTFVMKGWGSISKEVSDNLLSLANFIAEKTLHSSEGLSESTVRTMININLQISEGLLEGEEQSA